MSSLVAGTAGCAGNEQRSETPSDVARTDNGRTASFEAVQPGIVLLETDRLAVSSNESQYCYVRARTTTTPAELGDPPTLRFDGAEREPLGPASRRLYRRRTDEWFGDSGNGWLLYELPPVVSEARLVCGSTTVTPPADIRERLQTPAASLDASVSFPAELSSGDTPTISVTVMNRSDRPGQFVAGLTRSGPSVASTPVARRSALVAAGETTEVRITDEPLETDEQTEVRYELTWSDGRTTETIPITN